MCIRDRSFIIHGIKELKLELSTVIVNYSDKIAAEIFAHKYNPVSYTPLAVYKRQEWSLK